MSDSRKVAGVARFMFERLFTGKADLPMMTPPREQVDFLRVFQPESKDYPPRVHVCLAAEAQSTLVNLGGMTRRPLNNIRVRFLSGPYFRLFRCAACGWAAWSGDVVASLPYLGCCPQCKAQPSNRKCSMWHSFGVCDQCTDEAEDDCPFAVPADPDSKAAAAHVA